MLRCSVLTVQSINVAQPCPRYLKISQHRDHGTVNSRFTDAMQSVGDTNMEWFVFGPIAPKTNKWVESSRIVASPNSLQENDLSTKDLSLACINRSINRSIYVFFFLFTRFASVFKLVFYNFTLIFVNAYEM